MKRRDVEPQEPHYCQPAVANALLSDVLARYATHVSGIEELPVVVAFATRYALRGTVMNGWLCELRNGFVYRPAIHIDDGVLRKYEPRGLVAQRQSMAVGSFTDIEFELAVTQPHRG